MRFTSPAHQLSDDKAAEIIREAPSVAFPWQEAVPQRIAKWFLTAAKAHNTSPEFLFCGCLSTTAALMGAESAVKVRDTYSEPTNIFTICLAESGLGKTQAF